MKISDIKSGAAFSSAWWMKQAPPACKGVGVEKRLDVWKQVCTAPASLEDLDAVGTAVGAADDLKKALKKAKDKAGKDDKALKGIAEFNSAIDRV